MPEHPEKQEALQVIARFLRDPVGAGREAVGDIKSFLERRQKAVDEMKKGRKKRPKRVLLGDQKQIRRMIAEADTALAKQSKEAKRRKKAAQKK